MRALLDVNVLIALLDPPHIAHLPAYQWLAANTASGWASCPLTENGCLRLLINPRYTNPLPPEVALAKLETSKNSGHHVFWPDSLSITDSLVFDLRPVARNQQVTDIYLLALAVAHGGRLVTFDQSIRREMARGSDREHLVTL